MKATLIATIVDKREAKYQGDKTMLRFDLEDTTGAIQSVVFDDLFERFNDLQLRNTYKFNNIAVKKNPKTGQLELKFYKDTDIQKHAPMEVTHSYSTIDSIKQGERCHLRAIIASTDDARYNLLDENGETTAFLRPYAGDLDTFNTGDIVTIDGRAATDSRETIYVDNIQSSNDSKRNEELTSFWDDKKNGYIPTKRQKTTESVAFCNLKEIKALSPGARISDVRGIVRYNSFAPVPQKDHEDRVKYTMSIADDSNVAIGVGIFCDSSVKLDLNPGDAVLFDATVSSFGGVSLTTNAVKKHTDPVLMSWWQKNMATSFEELSTF